MTRFWPTSLTSRLVLIAVALVVASSVLLGGATLAAVGAMLGHTLDNDVRATLTRAANDPSLGLRASTSTLPNTPKSGERDWDRPGPHDHDDPGGPHAPGDVRGQAVGTLTAVFATNSDGDTVGAGNLLSDNKGTSDQVSLSMDALTVLSRVPADGELHRVLVPELGSFRVAALATGDNRVVAGLPTAPLDRLMTRLLTWGALLVGLGAAAAAAAGTLLVRRQLKPLREVAATAHRVASLPLDSGTVELGERVPTTLTGSSTEVGQVADAVNAMLDHVEWSLASRQRSEEQVRQFVADASHELRTPLTTIKGYAELARRRPDDSEGLRHALAKVESESGRMSALVEDLLLLARLDSGRPLEQEPVDITRLLLEAVSDARVTDAEHRWHLDLPDQIVEIQGDEQRLHQVVTNLLTNAAKYSGPGSTITVSAGPGRIDVHDDGPGFAPEVRDHAFDRFVRGDDSRTRDAATVGGYGLGLSLVQAIMAAHGGSVELHSVPGDTTVSVLFNVVSPTTSSTGSISAVEVPPTDKK